MSKIGSTDLFFSLTDWHEEFMSNKTHYQRTKFLSRHSDTSIENRWNILRNIFGCSVCPGMFVTNCDYTYRCLYTCMLLWNLYDRLAMQYMTQLATFRYGFIATLGSHKIQLNHYYVILRNIVFSATNEMSVWQKWNLVVDLEE